MMYHGQTTIGHLPRWLGDDGNITYGTRIPHIVTFTAASGRLTSQEMETLYLTSILTAGITNIGTGSVIIANGVVVQETQSSAPGPDANMYAVYVEQQTHKGFYGVSYCAVCTWCLDRMEEKGREREGESG